MKTDALCGGCTSSRWRKNLLREKLSVPIGNRVVLKAGRTRNARESSFQPSCDSLTGNEVFGLTVSDGTIECRPNVRRPISFLF